MNLAFFRTLFILYQLFFVFLSIVFRNDYKLSQQNEKTHHTHHLFVLVTFVDGCPKSL